MEEIVEDMERAYKKQVSLFEDLRHTLGLEREDLINLDIKGIWAVLEKKQEILKEIEATAHDIQRLKALVPTSSDRGGQSVGINRSPVFMDLARNLASLKEEVKLRVSENTAFIQDTLGFIEELVSLLAEGGRVTEPYQRIRKSSGRTQPMILCREV